MAALVVPTIFTAVDRITGVIQRMQRSVGGFAGKASIGINALNNGLNRLLPSFRGMASRYLSMAKTIAVFGLAAFSIKTILAYEKSLAHLHGLLNTLSDSGFTPFRMEVNKVAKDTQVSAAIVADAFTKIAERNIALAKTPGSLGAITREAIILSRAANIELVPAIEGIVNLLYQFGLSSKDAGRVSNALAAGFVKGSSSIENQIEAFKKFGSVAKHANLTLEQSVGLIQTVAHTAQGQEAGIGLRNIILYLQKYKQAYDKNGKFDINVALQATADHLHKLGSEQKQNIFLQDLFGKRTANVALTLLDGVQRYKDLTAAVTGTTEAQALAAKNTDNVTDVFKRLVATYQNYITSNENTLPGLQKLKDLLRYVTNNMDGIIGAVVSFVKWLLILKGVIWATQVALGAYNIVMGIMGAVTGVANIAIGESAIALGAYRLALLLGLGPTTTMGATVSGLAGSFGVANVAAAGFFATLSEFIIPAALLALGGLAIWKTINGDGTRTDSGKSDTFNRKKPATFGSQFGVKSEESAYQAWWIKMAKTPGIDRSALTRTSFDDKYGDKYHPYNKALEALGKVPISTVSANSDDKSGKGQLDIHLHDASNKIDTMKFTGHNTLPIPVKVTSTTGQK